MGCFSSAYLRKLNSYFSTRGLTKQPKKGFVHYKIGLREKLSEIRIFRPEFEPSDYFLDKRAGCGIVFGFIMFAKEHSNRILPLFDQNDLDQAISRERQDWGSLSIRL